MMSELERGKRIPAHNTVVVIAELKFVLHPVTEKPFTEDELFDIGAEFLDPSTGRYNFGQREPTIPALIALELKNVSTIATTSSGKSSRRRQLRIRSVRSFNFWRTSN
jgi:hypothetical protein